MRKPKPAYNWVKYGQARVAYTGHLGIDLPSGWIKLDSIINFNQATFKILPYGSDKTVDQVEEITDGLVVYVAGDNLLVYEGSRAAGAIRRKWFPHAMGGRPPKQGIEPRRNRTFRLTDAEFEEVSKWVAARRAQGK